MTFTALPACDLLCTIKDNGREHLAQASKAVSPLPLYLIAHNRSQSSHARCSWAQGKERDVGGGGAHEEVGADLGGVEVLAHS